MDFFNTHGYPQIFVDIKKNLFFKTKNFIAIFIYFNTFFSRKGGTPLEDFYSRVYIPGLSHLL